MNKQLDFFATCPKNLEGLLEEELISLGSKHTKQTVAGVKFAGDLELAYFHFLSLMPKMQMPCMKVCVILNG